MKKTKTPTYTKIRRLKVETKLRSGSESPAKKILITGGSGSLGRHIAKKLVALGFKDIISLSRDEGVIKEAKEFVGSPYVTFIVGDVRDPITIRDILKDANLVFHTAAMKDVVLAELHPREVLKNNLLGTLNLLENSENVERFLYASSDKAIEVVNCYGASKLLAEYLVRETNGIFPGTFVSVRSPNFLGSRGSVLDVWKNQIKEKGEITITDPEMTRFFITLPEAASFFVDLSMRENLTEGVPYYPIEYTKKFRLGDLAEAFVSFFPETKIIISGKRIGEKTHENYAGDVSLISAVNLREMIKPYLHD